MDYEKLVAEMDIDTLRKSLLENSDPDGPCIEDDLMQDAATALSTLQAENERLRVEVENYRKGHCAEDGCATEKDRDAVLAELEQVKRCIEIVENQRDQMKRERDAAVEDLHKLCPAWKWDGEEG